jgi:photosystem II stability/assembly factor-like uncharacterized protein
MSMTFPVPRFGWALIAAAASCAAAEDTWVRQAAYYKTPIPLASAQATATGKIWAVGTFGTLVASADGGATWNVRATGTAAHLLGVHFPTDDSGFAVGGGGEILRSVDGGGSWTRITPEIPEGPHTWYDVRFTDAKTGYVCGTRGYILKTLDGGATWVVKTASILGTLKSLSFPARDTGYAAGADGKILKTYNGGNSWTVLLPGFNAALNGILFTGLDTGYAVGGSYAIKTVDGGLTWDGSFLGTGLEMTSISRSGGGTFVAVASDGKMFSTTDGGSNWLPHSGGTEGALSFVRFADPLVGYAAGARGTVFRTADAGVSWQAVYNAVKDTAFENRLTAVRFADRNYGWAVGLNGIVLKTEDGGETWNRQTLGTSVNLRGLYVIDARTALIIGDDGVILNTVDGGAHWVARESGAGKHSLDAIFFTDANTGYVAGSGSIILKTMDGGDTWTTLVDGPHNLNGLAFTDPSTGYAVGAWTVPNSNRPEPGLVLKTVDGGKTWLHTNALGTEPLGALNAISFADANTAVAAGVKSLYRTTNGGGTWEPTGPPANFGAVQCLSASQCYALPTGAGYLAKTVDGTTWVSQSLGNFALYGMHFPTPDVGYLVGAGGVILKLTNGDPVSLRPGAARPGKVPGKDVHLRDGILTYTLDQAARVRITVRDTRGRLLAKGMDGFQTAGTHTLSLAQADSPGSESASMRYVEWIAGDERLVLPWF